MRAPSKTVRRARRLRAALTSPELVLWSVLRGAALDGLRFRRQHPLGPFVLDFYCPALKLAVEVDGSDHFLREENRRRDGMRDVQLAARGIKVLRIPASDVMDLRGRDAIAAAILGEARERAPSTAFGGPPPP